MADDHGMLFVFERPQIVGFWMKNTPMPLDLLFVGQDGRVRRSSAASPFRRRVIAAAEPVRFVLELKAGTAQGSRHRQWRQAAFTRHQRAPTPGSGG